MVEKTVSAVTVANLEIVKSIQLAIGSSAKPARRMDSCQYMKVNQEEMPIPGGWSTSKIFGVKKRIARYGSIVLLNTTMKK